MIRNCTIYKSENDYASFPGLIRMTHGIAVPFLVQPVEKLRAIKLHPHYAPLAEQRYAVSTDGLQSWQVVDDLPVSGGFLHATRHGLMVDCALSEARLLRVRAGYQPGTDIRLPVRREIVSRGGKSSGEQEITDFGPFKNFYPFDIERLSNGSVLAAGYWFDRDLKPVESGAGSTTVILRSDDGDQWEYLSHIPNENRFSFTESDVLDLGAGRVVCLLRTDWAGVSEELLPDEANGNEVSRDGYGYFLYQSESTDFGKTWSIPRRLPVWGHPPFCIRLRSGNVLMVYGHRRPPFEVRAVLSRDQCRTWDLSTLTGLHRFEPGRYDLGYPVCTELAGGEIFCVFYGYATEDIEERAAHAIWSVIFTEDDLLRKQGEPIRLNQSLAARRGQR